MQVADGVYVVTDHRGMVNSGLIELDDGLLVVDTLFSADEAQRIVDYAAHELRKPIRAVFLTHEHFDHTDGLGAFSAPVIVSEATAQFLAKDLAKRNAAASGTVAENRLPSVTFGNRLTIRSRNRHLRMVNTGGHTPGSSYLYIPEQRILFTGDIVVDGTPYMADGEIGQWLDVLNHLRSLSPEVVVIGHGRPSGPEIIDRLAGKLILFREAVREKTARGRSAEQICTEIMTEQGIPDHWREMVMATVRKLLAGD